MSTESRLREARNTLSRYKSQREYLYQTSLKIHSQFEDDVLNVNTQKTNCYNAMISAVSTDIAAFSGNMQTITDNLEYSWDMDGYLSSSESSIQLEISSLDTKISQTEDLIRMLVRQLEHEREEARKAATSSSSNS